MARGDDESVASEAFHIYIESDVCGIYVVSPHSQSLHLSVYFGVYFPTEQ